MEGTIQQLFEGHHMNYINCINVDYKSNRKESFYGVCRHNSSCSSYLEIHDLMLFSLKILLLLCRPSTRCERLSGCLCFF